MSARFSELKMRRKLQFLNRRIVNAVLFLFDNRQHLFLFRAYRVIDIKSCKCPIKISAFIKASSAVIVRRSYFKRQFVVVRNLTDPACLRRGS